ncbi:MAG: hypothetical protein AAFR96_07905 [Planctomycetota bacterium]
MPGVTSTDSVGSVRALVSDVYVNLKLSLKLDLPKGRESVPEFFDRVRRRYPRMVELKRYRDELALETSGGGDEPYRWLAVRSRNIRSGVVNPESWGGAHALHEHVLEVAPYFLSISPLDIESVEVLFGMDLLCSGNHDEVVFDALVADSPLARLVDGEGRVSDCQPVLSWTSGVGSGFEVQYEVKTRLHDGERGVPGVGGVAERSAEPLSVYLTCRRVGPVGEVGELIEAYRGLSEIGERLVDEKVVPHLVMPLRESISSG